MRRIKMYLMSVSALPLILLFFLEPSVDFEKPDSNAMSGLEVIGNPCTEPIIAENGTGPELCFVRGTFVDFYNISGPSNVTGANWGWSSTPALSGFNTTTGIRIHRSYYIPPTTTPGCYRIKLVDESLGQPCGPDIERFVTIRILASASDSCTECDLIGGPGGPDGAGGDNLE